MIAALGFLETMQIGVQLLLFREGGSIDAREHRVVVIAAPIGARHLHQLEGGSDLADRRQMRAAAQVEPMALR